MMKNLKGKKLWALVAVLVVAVAAVISSVWLLPQAGQDADARLGTKIPEVMPSSADMAVISPAFGSDSQKWWASVSGHMTTDAKVSDLKPYEDSSFQLLNYGYSRSINPVATKVDDIGRGPDQAVYIESKTEEGAVNVEKWLKDDKVIPKTSDTVSTRVGNINIVSRKLMLDHLMIDNKDKNVGSLSSRSDFSAKSPTMWVNFDAQQQVLASGGDEKQTDAVKSMFVKGLGISPGTVWQSSTEDFGVSWTGGYVSGGVKKSNLKPSDARSAFESDAKTVMSSSNAAPNMPENAVTHSLSVIDPGLSKMLSYFSVQYGDASLPVVGNPGDAPAAGKDDVAASLKLIAWNNLTEETGIGQNAYASESIRASESSMTMQFSK